MRNIKLERYAIKDLSDQFGTKKQYAKIKLLNLWKNNESKNECSHMKMNLHLDKTVKLIRGV